MPRASLCTLLAWLLPALDLLGTWAAVSYATAHRSGGDWFPGLLPFIIGCGLAALAGFGCGLAAILRRERHRWFALPPFLAGLAAILWAINNILESRIH